MLLLLTWTNQALFFKIVFCKQIFETDNLIFRKIATLLLEFLEKELKLLFRLQLARLNFDYY